MKSSVADRKRKSQPFSFVTVLFTCQVASKAHFNCFCFQCNQFEKREHLQFRLFRPESGQFCLLITRKTMSGGNSFEEIGFMQSGSSTSDLESGSFIYSEQYSSSESFATTNSQLKQLEFELAWKTRETIIGNLSQHTTLLSGLIVNADGREKMQKANVDLVAALMKLPLKTDGRLSSLQAGGRSADGGPNALIVDLSWQTRSRIVDTLMANHNIALLGADSVGSEFKSKLIDRNNDLACELLKLRSRTVAISSDSSTSNGTSR